jgi:hypothetical protein
MLLTYTHVSKNLTRKLIFINFFNQKKGKNIKDTSLSGSLFFLGRRFCNTRYILRVEVLEEE